MFYPIVIHKSPESDYGVTVPDLPGCFSAGSTIGEAIELAKEAVRLHIDSLIADGEPVPEASAIDTIVCNPEFAGAMFSIVEADVASIKAMQAYREGAAKYKNALREMA